MEIRELRHRRGELRFRGLPVGLVGLRVGFFDGFSVDFSSRLGGHSSQGDESQTQDA